MALGPLHRTSTIWTEIMRDVKARVPSLRLQADRFLLLVHFVVVPSLLLLTSCAFEEAKVIFFFDPLKSSTAKPSRFPRFPESLPESGHGSAIRAPPRVPGSPNQPPGFPTTSPTWGSEITEPVPWFCYPVPNLGFRDC